MSTSDCKTFLMGLPELEKLGLTANSLKRRSKKPAGGPGLPCPSYVRTFEVTGLPDVMFEVTEAAKTGLLSWRLIRAEVVSDGGLLLEVNRILMCQMADNGYVDASDIPRHFEYEKLPKVECDGGKEDVDFENCELLALDDKGMTCFAGGDWQNPVIFSAVWRKGKMYCGKGTHQDYRDGISNEEMLKIVYPEGVPAGIKTQGDL